MKVSLNWVKKYVDLPDNVTTKDIAHDLTLKTVEVESVENTKDKFHDIVVGKILDVKEHPNADSLRVCIVDIGEKEPVQIVCGGSNLYADEMVVISKPGAMVYWHGEGEPVVIKETKMRGEYSYGMICGAEEVFLGSIFPPKDEKEIVDLKGIDCKVGQNIADALGLGDTIIEIDNKSLTNRPDLWGHYGIARELSVIYNVPLKKLDDYQIPENLPKYSVEINNEDKCRRYVAIEIDGIKQIDSPLWMQNSLINAGMRPINAIVDITNYVMLAVGQPLHAFDKTHVEGEKIVVRNANDGEKLLLLDDNIVNLDSDDLVICDSKEPMALAGIKGGKKDSILEDTTGIVLEVANFCAPTIRKSGKKFNEKTDAAIRFEKGIDTQRVDLGISMALALIKDIFPESKIVKYNDVYPVKTENEHIKVSREFLDTRLGTSIDFEKITTILTNLGYDVNYKNEEFDVVVPTWRSTGDVSLKDDVMGDIARIIGYDNFEVKPLTISIDNPVIQNDVLLERRINEYLTSRCGFTEIYTYPWIDEKYLIAAGIDTDKCVKLATPPAPELVNLRSSLVPGLLEAISKNLRYFDSFKIYEMTQVFENGEYHESSDDETLPIHKKYLAGAIVGKDAKEIFLELKGVIENMSGYTHMEPLGFVCEDKMPWADKNAYLSITLNDEVIGSLALVSMAVMNDCKIKRTNVAMFELNVQNLVPFLSRTNTYESLPQLPLVEKDLAVIVDKNISWKIIEDSVKPLVKKVEFVDEYIGGHVPEGKKSITFNFKLVNDETTLTSEEINNKMKKILKTLNKTCGAELREE